VNALTASAAMATGRVQLANVRQLALVTARMRALWVMLLFVFVTLTACVRIGQLGLFEQAPERTSLAEALLPSRGEITDRNGMALARAFASYSLWFNPKAMGEQGAPLVKTPEEVARALNMPLLAWHIKSTTKAQQGLYEYDAVSRLRDSQLSDVVGSERVKDIHNYIIRGVLWQAFEAERQSVLLIDEIDKADIEFPNDLLREIDRMEFYVYETRQTVKARQRPVVMITSNNEKELPDAFLRRCFFHYIKFPDKETMQKIVDVHFPGLKKELLKEALEVFFQMREIPGLKKKPSTSELLDWLKLLLAEDISPEALKSKDSKSVIPPLHGALLKNEQDVQLFERLVFMARAGR
jgi:MoxR-like ATPase